MSFLNPFFLVALLAVGLPLVLHFLKLRKARKLSFPTLSFFKALQKSTLRRIELKRWLLLLLRMLALACLAMVLARPFLAPNTLGISGPKGRALHAILIDNSASMNRIGQNGPLLEQAQQLATQLIDNGQANDRFIIQTTNGPGFFTTISQASASKDRILEIEAKNTGSYLAERYGELVETIENAPYPQKNIYLISDAQESSLTALLTDLSESSKENAQEGNAINKVEDTTEEQRVETDEAGENTESDKSKLAFPIPTTLIALETIPVQNTYISSIELSTHLVGVNTPLEVFVEVTNASDIPVANQFLSFELEGQQVGQYTLSLTAGESRLLSFDVRATKVGSNLGMLRLEGDEYTPDNEYPLSIFIPKERSILWVEGAKSTLGSRSPLELVAQSINNPGYNSANSIRIEKRSLDNWDDQDLDNYDAVLLHELSSIPGGLISQLLPHILEGLGLWIVPGPNSQINSYNTLLSSLNVGQFQGQVGKLGSFNPITNATSIIDKHPIFDGLFDRSKDEDLRVDPISIYYQFLHRTSTADGGFELISNDINEPVLYNNPFGKGQILVSSMGFSAGFSDIQLKAIFPALLYRSFLYISSGQEGGLESHVLGQKIDLLAEMNPESSRFIQGAKDWPAQAQQSPEGVRFQTSDYELESGWIELKDEVDSKKIALIVPIEESSFSQISQEKWTTRIEDSPYLNMTELNEDTFTSEIQAISFGREIWPWFLLAAMVLLVLESIVGALFRTQGA